MANNVQLDEGSSGKYAETNEVSPGVHRQTTEMRSVAACKLKYQGTARTSITCTNAGTDYAAAGAIPAGSTYVSVYCSNTCQVAVGEATSSTLGADVGAGMPTVFPLAAADVSAGRIIHARSSVAGSVVYLTYLSD